MSNTIKIRVKRYAGEGQPTYDTFTIHFQEDITILDALQEIKEKNDGSLTFRWSCRMGICGSCGAMVNGKPVLMCETYLRDLPHTQSENPVTVEPLRNFPIVKDLVVDIDDGMEKFRQAMPYMDFAKNRQNEMKENPQTPRERKKLEQTSQCIKCMLCYSACPVYGMDKKFIGPAAGALAYRYQADTRELKSEKKKRTDSVIGKDGVWKCSFVGECSTVCPKKVDPALALQRLKVMGAMRIVGL